MRDRGARNASAAVLVANPCVLSTELARGETIHRMRAKTGVPNRRVDRLTLNSDDRQDPGGGETSNKEVDWQPAANQILLGLSGRSGSELDSFRAVISTFGPLPRLHRLPVQAASLRPGPPEKAAGSEGP